MAYDPAKISYEQLLEVFWHNVDPTDGGGQFCDRGNQYRTAIFYESEAQKRRRRARSARSRPRSAWRKPMVTQVVPLEAFYPAEEYHQDFYKKNPVRYHDVPERLRPRPAGSSSCGASEADATRRPAPARRRPPRGKDGAR